jgi:hypothetical protein
MLLIEMVTYKSFSGLAFPADDHTTFGVDQMTRTLNLPTLPT